MGYFSYRDTLRGNGTPVPQAQFSQFLDRYHEDMDEIKERLTRIEDQLPSHVIGGWFRAAVSTFFGRVMAVAVAVGTAFAACHFGFNLPF